jgi:PAS domain S-box-containing protein
VDRAGGAIEHAGLIAAVEQAADGIVITNTCGTIQYVNPAFTAMTGYTRDEAVGQNPRLLKSGRQSAAFYQELWSTVLSGNVWQGELVNRRKDGSLYSEEMRITPVRDASHAITGYIAIKRDVSEQRAAQEARAFLAAIVESSEDAIMATTPEGLIRAWNRGAEGVFGYSAEEAIGKHVSMLMAPERLDDLKQFIGKLVQGITVSQYESLCLRKDGSTIHVSVTGSPIRNSAGEVAAMSAVIRDTSERWKSEQRHRESEERFRNMADGNPALMWVTGANGEVQFINRAYQRFFGTTCEELQSGRWQLLIHPDDAPAYIEAFNRAVKEHTSFSGEARFRRADGEWRLMGSKAEPRISPSGEYLGMVGLSADITEREQAKRALRDSQEFAQSTIDALSSHICVLDETGVIVAVNRAWKDFAEANRPEDCGEAIEVDAWRSRIGEGVNYLDVCRRSVGELAGEAAEFVEGIQAVLKGERRLYSKEYSCHSPNVQRWFLGRVTRFFSSSLPRVVVEHINITERKQAEELLRESEERFRTLADCCPIGIWVTDAQGVNCFANRAYLESSGITQDDGVDHRWRSIIHPDDAPGFFEKFERALKEHIPFHTERRSRRADGQWCWMESSGIPRFSSEGEFLGLAGTSADITERKQAVDALQESEERFRAMADGCPTPIWVSDAEGAIQFTNRPFREFCGVTHELVEGHKWQLLIHPDDLLEFVRETDRAVQTHATMKAEVRVRRFDGEWRWMIVHTEPRFSPSGEFLGHVGLSTDITERKQAEQALKDSEEKFRQLAENIREVFFVMTVSGSELLYVNPAAEQVWGVTRESLYRNPMSWADAIHPDDQARARSLAARQLQGELGDSEFRILTPDGKEKWIRSRTSPVRDQDGKVIRVVGVAEETTERKRFEAELINARKTAESANLAKSRFLANMSHEIRTPMNGVIGMNQLLLETDLTAEQRRYVEVAQSSGRTLLSLIDNILDLSKIEAGGTTLENLAFGLNRTVDEVIQLLRVQAGAKGLRIVSRISPKIPELLYGDARRLGQVLTNLIANAIKFTERGAITLDADLDSQSDKAASIRFTVSDTGIGIPEDMIPALFSPFVQADASTTRKYGGSGLGLAISKQLVEMMGGSIGVSSWEGRGSTFRFTVTLGLVAIDQRQSALQSAPFWPGRAIQSPVDPALQGHGERILIAEDNPTNREVLLAQLKKLGYEAGMAANGAEAVEAVERESFDLVLMDCQMPLMDGYEATHRIRQSIHGHIPIVALTASALSPARERCLSEGMDDYLAKPVELPHLAAVLAKWIQKSRADKETARLQEVCDKPVSATFNSDSLMSRLMGDRELASTVLKGFLKDAPSQLKQLCDRLDESDAPGTRFKAHTLKGAAATVGAETLHDLALVIETDASAARLERCPELLVRAIDEFERFKSTVEQGGWNSKAIDGAGIEETSDV